MCLGLRERQNEVDRPTDRQTKGVGGYRLTMTDSNKTERQRQRGTDTQREVGGGDVSRA